MKKILLPVLALLVTVFSCTAQLKEERNVGSFTGVKSNGSFAVYLHQGDAEKIVIEAESGPIEKIITEVEGNTLKIYTEDDSWFKTMNFKNVNIYVTFRRLNEITGAGSGSVRLVSGLKSDNVVLNSSGSGSLYCEKPVESTGDLKLSNTGSGGCKIESSLTAKNKMSVVNTGSGGVRVEEVYADELNVKNTGSGSMKLNSGRIRHQSVNLTGSGSFQAENVVSQTCNIRKSGSGSIHINVENELTGSSSGSGSVYVKGDRPRIDFHSSGSGRIKHVN